MMVPTRAKVALCVKKVQLGPGNGNRLCCIEKRESAERENENKRKKENRPRPRYLGQAVWAVVAELHNHMQARAQRTVAHVKVLALEGLRLCGVGVGGG